MSIQFVLKGMEDLGTNQAIKKGSRVWEEKGSGYNIVFKMNEVGKWAVGV